MINKSLPNFSSFYAHTLNISLLFLLLLSAPVFSKDQVVEKPTVKQMLKVDDPNVTEEDISKTNAPYDRLNRGTPRSSVMSLSQAME